MNTMVGLQASLHTSVVDEISELMKNENTNGMTGEDDTFDADDFDAEELLKSPLFFNNSNDKLSSSVSNENSFGTFEDIEEDGDKKPSPDGSAQDFAEAGTHHTVSDYNQYRSYDVVKQAPVTTFSSPMRTQSTESSYTEDSFDSGNGGNVAAYPVPQALSPEKRAPSLRVVNHLPNAAYTQQYPQQDNYDMGMSGNYAPQSLPIAPYCSPERSQSFNVQCPQPSSSFQQQSYGSPSQTSSYNSQHCDGSPNQLAQMRQFAQQMQVPSQHPQLDAHTVHGGEAYGSNSNPMVMGQSLSNSMHEQRSHSFHGSTGMNPAFPGIQNHHNVAIGQAGGMADKSMSDLDGSSHDKPPGTLNEAMEKLCESMKRSAMSRSLVKQFSGRSLVKQGSARSLLARQNSGLMMKQRSNRSLMRHNSNRSLMDDASGRGTPTSAVPIRRHSSMNAKHHLQHPGRGVYRHDSQQSLGGHSNHGCGGGGSISLHIDGRNLGTL